MNIHQSAYILAKKQMFAEVIDPSNEIMNVFFSI